jgi:hypothetical protein
VWAARAPLTAEERAAFGATVVEGAARAREVGACADGGSGVISEASVARRAIELALVERGYLHYRRRSILPPIKRK